MVNKDLLLTREELRDLRNEIVLNSLYTSDYENTHHILPRDVQDFFDGYVEYLYELAEENGEKPDIQDLCIKYDNPDNLENWYYCFEDNPLLNYVEKMRQNHLCGNDKGESYAKTAFTSRREKSDQSALDRFA